MSELHTPIGTLQVDVVYRTKMTILPEDRKVPDKNVLTISDNIMIKSDHFPKESPRCLFIYIANKSLHMLHYCLIMSLGNRETIKYF